MMDSEGINQAEVARRMGISRARVTQVMSLLELPDDLKVKLLDGDPAAKEWSIRRAFLAVGG